ncbi:hypothetical protein FLONG3_523 [Fusarium longipes]|uniref:Fucose-specific lectin n=1 Tax=Fusarium longipes TaxID=694270 RepID=A0A395TAC1_9HYPO|nr:hypothetical protein FLONG3_523 [Fusarium longipes]
MTCTTSTPKDIASVQIDGKTYVFFVNKQDRLCYVHKTNDASLGDFSPKQIQLRSTKSDVKKPVQVKPGSQQIAAVAWVPKDKDGNPEKDQCQKNKWQIRVYSIGDENGRGYLQEACFGDDTKGDWTQGFLGSPDQKKEGHRRYVDDGSSLAAIGSRYQNLQVFVSGRGQNGLPKIEVHSYKDDHPDTWVNESIQEPLFTA